MFHIFAVTEHRRKKNQIFLVSYQKKIFPQNFHFGPIRWVPRWFSKISIIYSQNLHFNLVFWVIFENYSMRMLSVGGNNFVAHWTYEEMVSLHTEYEERIFVQAQPAVKCEHMYIHAEHTRNKFHRWLSIRVMDFIAGWAYAELFKSQISQLNRIWFSKISCYRPLGLEGFGFCKKSPKNKFHSCVPLRAKWFL